MAILTQGIRVPISGDASELVRELRKGKVAAAGFAVAVTGALVGISVESAKMAARLDRDLNLVASLGGEAATSTKELRAEIKALGIEFGRDFRSLATANYQAVSGGFKSISESIQVTRAGTKLAVAGNADLVASTDIVVKTLNAFKLEADDASKVSAQLWSITRDGIITVEQLGGLLKSLPLTAASTGINLEQLGAAIATMTANGESAEGAMDKLRSAIIKLESEGITGSLLDRIDRLAGNSLPELIEIVGDQNAALGILNLAQNIDQFRANVQAAANVTEDFGRAVDTLNSDAMAQFAQAQERWNAALDEFGTRILPGVVATLNAGVDAFRFLTGGVAADVRQRNANAVSGGLQGPLLEGQNRPAVGPFFPTAPLPTVPPSAYQPGIAPLPQLENPFAPTDRIALNFDEYAENADVFAASMENLQSSLTAASDASDSTADSTGLNAGQMIIANAASSALSSGLYSLVSAMGLGESAVGRFVASVLADLARLALTSAIGLPGFATGGFTGARGGLVHPGEFVFNADAVQRIGLGRLQREHALAGGGIGSMTANVTVNAPNNASASDIARITTTHVGEAMRELQRSGQSRLFRGVSFGGPN